MKAKLKKFWVYVSERVSVIVFDILIIVIFVQYANQLNGSQVGRLIGLYLMSMLVLLNLIALVIRDITRFNETVIVLNYLLLFIIMCKFIL